ncbi:MAG: tetratricopeptide repeat protein [Acidobacteriota bacterium]
MARKGGKKRTDQTSAPAVSPSAAERKQELIVAVLIALACLVIYYQVAGFDFINLDDDIYVYENAAVANGLSARSIAWAFSSFHAANWHPITWISHQLDATLFGLNAAGHHLLNLAFHIANSVLLFLLLRGMTKEIWKSAVIAAVFAVHPAHVESVAWIAERKDLLSTLLWLLTSIAYVRFTKDTDNKRAYWIALLLFALGLMAKPMLVTLPFVLLLLDYWPLKRIDEFRWSKMRPLVQEKLPFFVLSAISAVVTIFAQRSGGAVQTLETFSLQDRFTNSVVSYARYLVMMFYPADLGVWYPFDRSYSVLQIAGSLMLILGISAASVWQICKRPYLFVGWFWFVGTLVPVIGIVQIGRQGLADRYTYVPFIGLSMAVIWLLAEFAERVRVPARVVQAAAVIVLAALAIVAFRQASYWKNSETLYTRTLQVTPSNYLVEANYCRYLEKQNRLDEAFRHCSIATENDPRGVVALNTLGTVQLKQGKLEDARRSLQKATEIDSDYSLAYANLAIVEMKLEKVEPAIAYFDQAVAHDASGYFDARRRAEGYSSIGSAALAQKRYDIAAKSYEQALDAIPDNADFQRNLALAYRSQGRYGDAIRLLQSIIQRNPNSAEAHNTLGIIYAEQNRRQDAIAQFQRALQINPNFSQAQSNLKKALE